ncbi:MAG: alpha/beta hydrolase [Gammaproteobacteria bacterium]|nr:alpha/beta hydrolase [Gammaproteobacteria bacterium]
MKGLARLLPTLAVASALAACAAHEGAPAVKRKLDTAPFKIGVQRNVVYTPAGWPEKLRADVYIPRGIGPYPVVVLLHGGGWDDGDRADMDDIAEDLAGRGYAAVTVDYRLAPRHRFPAPLHDVQQALRWVRSKADTYQIDPARVAVFGYSSGAHLAALIGTVGEGDPLDAPHGGSETRVQAVVAGGTPADLTKLVENENVARLLGGGPAERPELYAQASPLAHVSPGDAPFFLYHGTWDSTVPIEQAEVLKAALDAAGVPAELFRTSVLGHTAMSLFDGAVVDEAIDLDRNLRRDV